MSTLTEGLHDASGSPLPLGELLGRGGEARVYALAGDPERAVKLYARPDEERSRKLKAMLARVPADPDRRFGHVSIAWPERLAVDASGAVTGFVMPRVDTRRYLPLHQLYHPRSRRGRAPGMSWRYLVRIARNLSGTLAALHQAGYVVGDLNESNILADDRALVTLVDLDSIQVVSGARVFRCTVGKGEYTPPELQGRSFRETTRRPSSDRFALAVLAFLLLMEGNHPFTGVFGGAGEPPGMEENIRSRRSPYFGRSALRPPPAAPPREIIGPHLTDLFRRCLLGPAWRRPDAREFQSAFEELEEELVACDLTATHWYRGQMAGCPWCQRRALLGGDPYPPAQALPHAERSSAGSAHLGPSSGNRDLDRDGRVPSAPPTGSGATRASSAAGNALQQGPGRSSSPSFGAPAVRPFAASVGPVAPAGPPAAAGGPRRVTGAPGFRGSWARFHRRLPLLSLLLVGLLAAPAVAYEGELRALLAASLRGPAGGLAGLLGAALLPPMAVAAGLYLQARRRAGFARALLLVERLLRAALAAAAVSLLASLAAGLALGRGSVLAGDWLLLPSLWAVSFVVLLRLVGPRRY
jgi:hypothetical protein